MTVWFEIALQGIVYMEKLFLCVCVGREREAPTFSVGVGVSEGHFTLIIVVSSFRQQ